MPTSDCNIFLNKPPKKLKLKNLLSLVRINVKPLEDFFLNNPKNTLNHKK